MVCVPAWETPVSSLGLVCVAIEFPPATTVGVCVWLLIVKAGGVVVPEVPVDVLAVCVAAAGPCVVAVCVPASFAIHAVCVAMPLASSSEGLGGGVYCTIVVSLKGEHAG